MTILLPSGRKLYYVEPSVGENRWGGPSITYMGVNDKNKWGRIETYGGKLVEERRTGYCPRLSGAGH
ncbi:MAG: hypothetical protein ACLRR6_02255 [Oscillospiraceae bacterium]